MRGKTAVVAAILWLVAVSAAAASEPPIPIKGRLLVNGWGLLGDYSYVIEGSSDTVTQAPLAFGDAELSPVDEQVVFNIVDSWPPVWGNICRSGLDGSGLVDITALAGLGGVNCLPDWSADGSRIAFQHADPAPGQQPCNAGWSVWVVEPDGSGLIQTMPPAATVASWAPDGYSLICGVSGVGPVTVDVDGTGMQSLPEVAGTADMSPDGQKIASSSSVRGTVDSQPGTWRRLILTDGDGSNAETLVEHFLPDSLGLGDAWWVGPLYPEFSPTSDQIAFLAALPYDPNGLPYKEQVEVWIYDLTTDDLTRITNDQNHDNSLSWVGPNTYPDSPAVTCGRVWVGFLEVTAPGWTSALRAVPGPPLPATYQPCGYSYDVTTTASYLGPISICLSYEDDDLAGGGEDRVQLLRYHAGGGYWEDITVCLDQVGNQVCGEGAGLSVFAAAVAPPPGTFPDVPSTGLAPGGTAAHWAFAEIEAAHAADIVSGFPDGSYGPALGVDRAAMATYIARAMAGGEASVPTGTAVATFPDVPTDHWAFHYVEYVAANNVVEGYPDGAYHPETLVSRGQMAIFVARAMVDPPGEAGLAGYMPPPIPSFPDVKPGLSCWRHIEYLREHGVVHGFADGRYCPDVTVTRDQMAVYIARAFGLTT